MRPVVPGVGSVLTALRRETSARPTNHNVRITNIGLGTDPVECFAVILPFVLGLCIRWQSTSHESRNVL